MKEVNMRIDDLIILRISGDLEVAKNLLRICVVQ